MGLKLHLTLVAVASAAPIDRALSPHNMTLNDEKHVSEQNWIDDLQNAVSSLQNQYNDAVNQLHQAQQSLTGVTTAVNELGQCMMKLPGAKPPLTMLADLGNAYSNGGFSSVRDLIQTENVEPLVDQGIGAIGDSIDAMETLLDNFRDVFVAGELNTAMVEQLPKDMLNIIIAQRASVPSLDCLLNTGLADHMESLVASLGPLMVRIGNKLKTALVNMMNALVGPNSPLGRAMSAIINRIAGKILPPAKRLEGAMGEAIASMCDARTEHLYAVAQGREPSDNVCALASGELEDFDWHAAIAGSITSSMTYVTEYLQGKINEKVWLPLLQKLTQMTISVQDTLMQWMDGLCGLIPEVGGAICATITVSISNLGATILAKLGSETVESFITDTADWFLVNLPDWSSTIADSILSTSQLIADTAADSETLNTAYDNAIASVNEATAPTLNIMASSSVLLAPLVVMLTPIVNEVVKTTLPTITASIAHCSRNVATLHRLVKATACGTSAPPETELPAPEAVVPPAAGPSAVTPPVAGPSAVAPSAGEVPPSDMWRPGWCFGFKQLKGDGIKGAYTHHDYKHSDTTLSEAECARLCNEQPLCKQAVFETADSPWGAQCKMSGNEATHLPRLVPGRRGGKCGEDKCIDFCYAKNGWAGID